MAVAGIHSLTEDGFNCEHSGKMEGVEKDDVEIFVRPVEPSPSEPSSSGSLENAPSNEIPGTPFVTTQRFEYPFPDTRYSPSEDRFFSLVSRPTLPSSLSTGSNSSISSSHSSTSSRSSTNPPISNSHGTSPTWSSFPSKAFPLAFPSASRTLQHRFLRAMSREPPMPPSLRRKWQQTSSQSLDSGLRNRLSTITDEDLQTTTEALSTPFDADGSVIPSSISRASPTSTDESASGTPGSISPEQLKDDRCGRGPEVEGNSYRVMPSTLTQATSQAQDRRLAILFLALLVCLTAAQSTFSSLMSFLSSLFLGS